MTGRRGRENSALSLYRQKENRTQKHWLVSMQKQLILVLGALLGSSLPAVGQTLAARLDLAQKGPSPGLTLLEASSMDFPPTTVRPLSALPPAEAAVRLPRALAVMEYLRPKLKLSSKVRVELVHTPFIRQGRVPLTQLWGGRLRLDGFAGETVMKNVLDGPLNTVHPGMMQPRAAPAYGISLSFRLGRRASL